MKAAQINKYGGSNVIEINPNTSIPQIDTGKILVEVYAASLNPFDYKLREGYMKDSVKSLPITLGTDFAGIVKEVSSDITDLKAGDEVYGNANLFNGGSGTIAEFVSAKTDKTALKPKTLDFIKSAALPLVASSALQAIEEHINLQSGQKILIQGGGGGIGSLAIQIAKNVGAYVAATASEETMDFVKSLGADQVIDYKKEDFTKIISGFDAVFDTVGGETAEKSMQVVKKGGIVVSMVGPLDQTKAQELGITAIAQSTKTTSEKLKRIAELVDSGKLQAEVDKVFPLEETAQAFDYLENEHPKGKVVIQIK